LGIESFGKEGLIPENIVFNRKLIQRFPIKLIKALYSPTGTVFFSLIVLIVTVPSSFNLFLSSWGH